MVNAEKELKRTQKLHTKLDELSAEALKDLNTGLIEHFEGEAKAGPPFDPPESKAARAKIAFKEELKSLLDSIALGQEALYNEIKELPQEKQSDLRKRMAMPKGWRKKLYQFAKASANEPSEGDDPASLQKLFDWSNETLWDIHLIGTLLITKGDYEEAVGLYQFLISLNPMFHEFPYSLGFAQQKLGKYEEAIQSYYVSILSSSTDPYPFVQIAQCHHKLEQDEEAIAAYQAAVIYAGEQAEHHQLIEQIQSVLDTILPAKEGGH